MIGYYAEVSLDGRYVQCHFTALPAEGLIQPGNPANTLVPVDAPPASWVGKTPTEVLHLFGGEQVWIETSASAQALPAVIAAIDAAADAARTAAIGDPARAIEYQRAEMQARAYAAAGYAGTVPRCVLAWATPKNWTGQQAADDIIATAEVWYEALDTIREMRLAAKEAARGIASNPEGTAGAIYAVQRTFLATLHSLMQGLA
jgi:hypothetical protein